jgi:membrane dipeptidase
MNELGVIVDLSHTGERTFYDAIATASKPVLLSIAPYGISVLCLEM